MAAERVTRRQLVSYWEARQQELRASGQPAEHIQIFLRKLDSLHGETSGDIGFHWNLKQHELRPVLSLAVIALAAFFSFLAWSTIGLQAAVLVLSLAAITQVGLLHWLCSQESRFSRELFSRAEFVRLELDRQRQVPPPRDNLLAF